MPPRPYLSLVCELDLRLQGGQVRVGDLVEGLQRNGLAQLPGGDGQGAHGLRRAGRGGEARGGGVSETAGEGSLRYIVYMGGRGSL